MRTSRAVISTFNMAIGLDVASTYFTPIWTRFLIAPLSLSFHRASPRLGRCAKHNSKTGFPGLEAEHPKFARLQSYCYALFVSLEAPLPSGHISAMEASM